MDRTSRRQLDADLRRLADGDRSAFHAVFQTVWPVVHRFTASLIADSGKAEDAAQLALMKVFARASQYDPNRDALTWILTLARFETMTIRRQTLRLREETGTLPDTQDPAPSPEESAIRRDLISAVKAALDDLSEQEVQTVIASVTEAERGDVAPATFRKRLQRAFARLRTVWKEKHG